MRIATILLAAAWTGAHAQAPSVEAYGQRPSLIDVDINPAGHRLAWVEDDGTKTRLVIHDLVTQKPMRILPVASDNRLRRIYWVTDDVVLLDLRVTRSLDNGRSSDEWQRWLAVDARGGKDQMLLMTEGSRGAVTGASLVRRTTARPGKVFMSTLDYSTAKHRREIGTRLAGGRKDSGWTSNLYEVDVRTGDGKLLLTGTPFTWDWVTSADGERVVRSEWTPKLDKFEILLKTANGWHSIHESPGCGFLGLISLSADQNSVIVRGAQCGDPRRRLFALPLDGSAMKVLIEDEAHEVEGVIVDPFDQQLLGVTLGGARQPTRWLDDRARRRSEGLNRSFKNSVISVVSRSADANRLVVLVESEESAPVYYLVDYVAKTADIINERYPKLNGVPLGKVREFQYQARDQYPLFGYLTVPPGASEKNLPIVVMPHGGPESRDEPGFDYIAQFLASRGYAVLQPQFRGSSGYGRAHADAGRQQWGLRMQDDVTDGVRALITQGIADPRRICIVGGSYGGYAALAGAAYTPDLYACAISINGVSDLPTMIGEVSRDDGRESNAYKYWREHIGSATDPQVISRSPARSAETIRAPILLIHGNQDTTVPIEQSRLMARALKAAGRKFEFVELEGDDHHLSTSPTRVRALREMEKFLGAHLAAPAPAP